MCVREGDYWGRESVTNHIQGRKPGGKDSPFRKFIHFCETRLPYDPFLFFDLTQPKIYYLKVGFVPLGIFKWPYLGNKEKIEGFSISVHFLQFLFLFLNYNFFQLEVENFIHTVNSSVTVVTLIWIFTA